MLSISMRAILAVFVLCGALVAGVVAFGSLSTTMLATGFHENEGEIYTIYVEDTARHFRMTLAGTRCFKSLPSWTYPVDLEIDWGAPDIGRSYARGSYDGAAFVAQLRCP